MPWPFITLLRFEFFSRITAQLKDCDYLFFFNSNIKFISQIDDDILPAESDDGLLAVLHPGFWDKQPNDFTYDRNPESTAFIDYGEGEHYFMGGFNGGLTNRYMELIETLKNNIRTDLGRDIIALWHDESHLNRYMLKKNPKILPVDYGYPEGWELPFTPKLLILDKGNHGGHAYLRNNETTSNSLFKKYFGLLKIFSNRS